MLDDFRMKSQGTGKGFCYYIDVVLAEECKPEDAVLFPELRELFLLQPPKRYYVGAYWSHPENRLFRIELLKKAIEIAENNLLESRWFLIRFKLRRFFYAL